MRLFFDFPENKLAFGLSYSGSAARLLEMTSNYVGMGRCSALVTR